MEITRLHCTQLPDVAILGVGRPPKLYVVHAQHLVALLKGNINRQASSRVFYSFLSSEAGQRLTNGGDLLAAALAGPLKHTMYTHRLNQRGGGSPSYFVTFDGVRDIVNGLPNADPVIAHKLSNIHAEFEHQFGLQEATPEQCAQDDADEMYDEVFTQGTRPSDGALRLAAAESNRALVAELRAQTKASIAVINSKDEVIALLKESAAKDAAAKATDDLLKAKDTEIALLKAWAAKDIEIAHLKASAARDHEIMELRMQLIRAEGRSSANEQERVVSYKKLKIKDVEFSKLIAVAWPNTTAGVDYFTEWPDQPVEQGPLNISAIPFTQVEMADGIDPLDHAPNSDIKHRHFGFCYEGPPISKTVLVNASRTFKEVYTVEVDHLHYVCVVLFNRDKQCSGNLGSLIYTTRLISTDVKLCQIPDREHQISVYKPLMPTKDPVLEMLKQPSGKKWCWISSKPK